MFLKIVTLAEGVSAGLFLAVALRARKQASHHHILLSVLCCLSVAHMYYPIVRYPITISVLLEESFWVVSIAKLVEVTDSAVLGWVVEVVSSNPARVKNIFSAFTGISDLFCLSISIFIINLYQLLILCSSEVLFFVKLYFSNTSYLSISLISPGSGRLS